MTETSVRRADARANRVRIVAAAADLFAEQGFEVSFNAVAQRAGVGNATLYRHFAGLEALQQAVFLDRACQVVHLLDGLHDLDPVEGLRRFLLWTLETADLCLLRLGEGRTPDCPEIEQTRVQIRDALDRILERGQAGGCIRAGIDRNDIVVAAGVLVQLARNEDVPQERKLVFLETLLRGLR
ncbi:TetR/AcrR family transcriptional regulator [Kineosporia mesophila]|uniref:TetR/AcrR family transcriptional regulator n=1 Tax=Kineosporia mesophila TaxID=566012 RepID=A0ABP6ZW08_9ACTN|nr:TetR/AcrR family transcriptional regulator [Kineosporia mesophila]MCD5355061.1 TetR/AcrR family transcriptional regulator [Kineosporia mesophila]